MRGLASVTFERLVKATKMGWRGQVRSTESLRLRIREREIGQVRSFHSTWIDSTFGPEVATGVEGPLLPATALREHRHPDGTREQLRSNTKPRSGKEVRWIDSSYTFRSEFLIK